jgi:hypothetical protein
MSNLHLFVAGSIHQGMERFSDISRGRQCSFMSFTALSFAHTLTMEQWTASNVDQILAEGDRIYLDAFESRSILAYGVDPSRNTFLLESTPYANPSLTETLSLHLTSWRTWLCKFISSLLDKQTMRSTSTKITACTI